MLHEQNLTEYLLVRQRLNVGKAKYITKACIENREVPRPNTLWNCPFVRVFPSHVFHRLFYSRQSKTSWVHILRCVLIRSIYKDATHQWTLNETLSVWQCIHVYIFIQIIIMG